MSGILNLSDITLPASTGYQRLINMAKLELPITSGLVGLYQFNGGQSLSVINNANPALPLLIVGSPEFSALGVKANYLNCFDTQLPDTPAFTYIVIAKPAATIHADNDVNLIGNYTGTAGGNGVNLSLNMGITSLVSGVANQVPSTINTIRNISGFVSTDWNIFSTKVAPGVACQASWSKSGTVVTTSAAAQVGRTVRSETMRIGGHYATTSQRATCEILAVAMFNVVLSDTDEELCRAAMRSFYSNYENITTL